MKMEMTERDKKLLLFLALFLIVVGIGYWGVRPLVKNIIQYNDDIEDEIALRDVNDVKIMELPMIEAENDELEKGIVKARTDFYPIMTSNEIDKMFTEMALNYGLYAYDLSISMPTEEAVLEPYQYSLKALTYSVEDEEFQTSSDIDDMEDGDSEEDSEFEDLEDAQPGTGIYMSEVNMRVGGDEAVLQKFIDDLSKSKKKHLVKNYRWEENTSSNIVYNDAEYELNVTYEKYIYITIDLFMCQE